MWVAKDSWRNAGLGTVFAIFSMSEQAQASCGLENEVLCEAEFQTVRACNKDVEVRTFCTNKPLPKITNAMRAEAKKYPELSDDYERMNGCLSDLGDCKAKDGKVGGEEVAEEVTRYKNMQTEDEIEPLRESITAEARETNRDAATLVMKRGFLRSAVDYHLIYRVFHDRQFHGSAEGVDLVSQTVVEQELREQIKLAGILKEMRLKFTELGDKKSVRATSTYEGIAMGQATMLDAVSCELGRLASINRDRQNKMRSISEGKIIESPPFSYKSLLGDSMAHQDPSDVTGIGRAPASIIGKLVTDSDSTAGSEEGKKPEPEKEQKSAAPKSTVISEDAVGLTRLGILGAPATVARIRTGAYVPVAPKNQSPDVLAKDETIFSRVSKKYREKEASVQKMKKESSILAGVGL